MKTVKYFASMVMLLAVLSGCVDKDRPTPVPKPDPVPEKPTPTPEPAPDPGATTTPTIIFSADFSKEFGKMTALSVVGDEGWQVDTEQQVAFISGKGNKPNEDWLLTPVFDFSTATSATISFDHLLSNAEKATERQTMWVSSDYEGDIASATWTKLTIPTYASNTDKEMVNSGEIKLPDEMMGQAKVVIAFKYLSTKKQAATWSVKNIIVKGEGGKLANIPTPTPEPTPTPDPINFSLLLSNGGLIRDNKIVHAWQVGDKVSMWAMTEDNSKVLTASAIMNDDKSWKFEEQLSPEWEKANRIDIAYLPAGNYDPQKQEIRPKMEVNKKVGHFLVSHYYQDLLIGNGSRNGEVIEGSLNSPYKRVKVILSNNEKKQKLQEIKLSIEGPIANASYSNKQWNGTPTLLKLFYDDKNGSWEKGEADAILLAIPTNETSLKVTLNYINQIGEKQEIEQIISVGNTNVGEATFVFPEVKIINPALAFKLNINERYWKEANQKAWNLLHANYGGEHDEKTARDYYGWTNTRPLTDKLMHSTTIYKDDVNLLAWRAEMKEEKVMGERDWGLMLGLETLDGTLVEVYPPLYFNTIGGYVPSMNGGRDGFYDSYCYVTAPAGEYRIVCFVKYHKDYIGTRNGANEKWYKLPYLDSRDYDETCRGGGIGKKYLNEPIPWRKSPYNGIEKVTVIDRVAKHSVAPRWRMGMTYQSRNDFKNNNPSYTSGIDGHQKREMKKGLILQSTLVNNSNNTLQGTIVAKCEYLPMFNPIGYWRFDIHKEAYKNVGGLTPFWTSWSHEVGRTDLTIAPNSETVAQVEMVDFNWRWNKDGKCGMEMLGPDIYIHFYWIDENGNEELMKRVDYIYMNNSEKVNFGDPQTNKNMNIRFDDVGQGDWREYKVGYGPSEGRNTPSANGFNLY